MKPRPKRLEFFNVEDSIFQSKKMQSVRLILPLSPENAKKIIFLIESGQSSILSILGHRTHFQTMNSNLFTDTNLVAYFSQET